MIRRLFLLITALLIFSGCSSGNVVNVKYRDDDVNLSDSAFQYLDTSKSSFVNGAWYDDDSQYMVIKLDDTYYHYCDLPLSAWEDFEEAESFGSEYNQKIKGKYDCRSGHVPQY